MPSRYKDARSSLNERDSTIRPNRVFPFMGTVKYPNVPYSNDDIQIITTDGDRLDLLAQQFYNDSSLWWIIAIANPVLKQNSIFPPAGSQIRVPVYIQNILASFYVLNNL